MSASLLESILDSASTGASVVGENHDPNSIKFDLPDFEAQAAAKIARLSGGGWDASEYGITREEAIARVQAADTPEARAAVIDDLKQRALRRASLDTSNGRVAMMSDGKLPWHGLGVLVDKAATSAEAIKLAGLDWTVLKLALSYEHDGKRQDADDIFAMVRGDTGKKLGHVGSRYQPIQNSEGFDFLDGVLEQFGAKYGTAGAIYGGRRVWMLAHFPQQAFRVNGTDEIEPFVIFANSHDGTSAAACYPTSVRVECANTFCQSRRQRAGKGLNIRHTGKLKAKITDAQAALGMAVQEFEQFREAAECMASKPLEVRHYAEDVLDAVLDVTAADALKGADALAAALAVTEANQDLARKEFSRKIERRGEILEDILARYESEACQKAGRGTAWAAFNAVTEHADHAKRYVGTDDQRRSRRFESVIEGEAAQMKQAAFELATA